MSRSSAHPADGFANEFISQYSARVKVEDATILRFTGGKHRIPDELTNEFLAAYAKDLSGSDVKHTYAEVASEIFPFFTDLDIIDPAITVEQGESPELKQEIAGWTETCIKSVASCLEPPDSSDNVGDMTESMTLLQKGLAHRDRLASSSAVLLSAPLRTVNKQHEISGVKIGLHIIWPNLLITREDAKTLRSLVVNALYKDFPSRKWDKIVAVALHHPLSSLRMIGSYKHMGCPTCSSPAVRLAEVQQRAEIGKLLSLSDSQCKSADDVKSAAVEAVAAKHLQLTKLRTYLEQCEAALNCSACGGRGRVADVAAGVYKLGAVVDAKGDTVEEDTRLALTDSLVAVHYCSVRCAAGAEATKLLFSGTMPPAPTARATYEKPADSDSSSDEDSLCNVLVVLNLEKPVPEQQKSTKASCVLDAEPCRVLFEQWLNSGVIAGDYSTVQVAQLYRLVSKAKSDQNKMKDGSARYIMVATLRGFGSTFCCNVQRHHTSNHVYFIITDTGIVTQRCHSSNPGCDKQCGKAYKLPNSVYTALYPFHPAVMAVLPGEVDDWTSGRMPYSYVKQFSNYVYLNRNSGTAFRFVLQNERNLRLHAYQRARLEKDNSSVLGKRSAEDQSGSDSAESRPVRV